MAATIQTSGELKARMTSLEKSLGGHARSASFGAGMTLLLGVVLIAGLGFYFWYGFSVIGGFLSEKTAASNIIDIIEGQLNDNLEPARDYLEKMVKSNAPSWAAMASNAVVDGMPAAREHAVAMSITAMDQGLEENRRHANAVVAAYIKKNEAKIKDAVQRLSSGNPKEADQLLADLKESFNKEMEIDVDSVVKKVSEFLEGLNGAIVKANKRTGKMTNLEAMQQELIMLFKRAMIDHTEGIEMPIAKN